MLKDRLLPKNLIYTDLEWLQTPLSAPAYDHGYQSYPCLFLPKEILVSSVETVHSKRNAWMDELQRKGVSTRPATHAVHMLSFYKEKYKLRETDFPNAYAADQCSISIPLFHGMKPEEQIL